MGLGRRRTPGQGRSQPVSRLNRRQRGKQKFGRAPRNACRRHGRRGGGTCVRGWGGPGGGAGGAAGSQMPLESASQEGWGPAKVLAGGRTQAAGRVLPGHVGRPAGGDGLRGDQRGGGSGKSVGRKGVKQSNYYYPCFTDGKTEAPRCRGICSG